MLGWGTCPGCEVGVTGSDGPGWVGCGRVDCGGWPGFGCGGWPGFGCGWVVGGTVVCGAVVVGFRTWPPSSAGGANVSRGRLRVAWSMNSRQIWAGSDPPDTADSPRTLSSLWSLSSKPSHTEVTRLGV